MVRTGQNMDLKKVDFSFIPSLRCNLRCPFCMYDASPDNDLTLNHNKTKLWLETVDWERIGSWGFYGGEPSIDRPLYDRFMDLIPKTIPKFLITNGAWSSSAHATLEFWEWMNERALTEPLRIVISGTPEHRKFQRASLIQSISKWEGVVVKGDDDIHPMGRAYKGDLWMCSKKCTWHDQPIRLGIFPTGHIILQNCDGAYPVIGTYDEPFDSLFNKAVKVRKLGCYDKEQDINGVLREVSMEKKQKPLTEGEFESLVDKASQPLEPERKPDAKEAETLESQTSGDCSESHTR